MRVGIEGGVQGVCVNECRGGVYVSECSGRCTGSFSDFRNRHVQYHMPCVYTCVNKCARVYATCGCALRFNTHTHLG